jgi:hypothetical protein
MANIKYTKEYLIKKLQDKAQELGNTPTIHDMSKVIPNARYNYLFYFSSWNDVIKSANLPKRQKITHSKVFFTKEELIYILQTKAKELNKTPSALELKDIIPNTWNIFAKHFSSFNNAIKEAGLKPTIEYNKYTNEELLKLLINKSKMLGRIPTSYEMKDPDKNWYINKFGTWNKALIEAGLKPVQIRNKKRDKSDAYKKYTKEQMIEYLTYYVNTKDKNLNFTEFTNNETLPSPTFIRGKLGVKTWLEVRELVTGSNCRYYKNRTSSICKMKERPIPIRDSSIGSFKNFNKEEYLKQIELRKSKRYGGFKHLTKKALLIMLEKEFLRHGTTNKNSIDNIYINKFPKSSYFEKKFSLKWNKLIFLYFNTDGTLKED